MMAILAFECMKLKMKTINKTCKLNTCNYLNPTCAHTFWDNILTTLWDHIMTTLWSHYDHIMIILWSHYNHIMITLWAYYGHSMHSYSYQIMFTWVIILSLHYAFYSVLLITLCLLLWAYYHHMMPMIMHMLWTHYAYSYDNIIIRWCLLSL